MQISFSIPDWSAATPQWQQTEEWQQWAEMPTYAPNNPPNIGFVPPLQRRRLSLPARLMFAAAQPLVEKYGHLPLVYCSHDGEINRSFALWLELLQTQTLSPMSFGLSVHNALAGQWSIFSGNQAEQTALCVQEAGLEIALIEAWTMLADYPQILVIIADEPLRPEYNLKNIIRAPFPYALALVLTQGEQFSLHQTPVRAEKRHYHGALAWIKAMVLGQFPFTQTYQQSGWRWERA